MDIKLDDLQLDNLKLFQDRDGYTFTSDSVLLANFVKTKKSDVCVDIGAGTGIISVLVAHKQKPAKIFAVELQKESFDLLQKNIKFNNMENVVECVNCDVKEFKFSLKKNVDVVFCNPPYYSNEIGKGNENEVVKASKFEVNLDLISLVEVASKMLKFAGKFYCVYPSNRLAEFCGFAMLNNLNVKYVLPIYPTQKKDSSVSLICCCKGGKVGLKLLPAVYSCDENHLEKIEYFRNNK